MSIRICTWALFMVCVEVREAPTEVGPLHLLGFESHTQVIRLRGNGLYLQRLALLKYCTCKAFLCRDSVSVVQASLKLVAVLLPQHPDRAFGLQA